MLDRPCPDCGYDSSVVTPSDVAPAVRDEAASWRPALGRSGAAVRPDPGTWSVLEYGCHVRDVLVLYDERLERMLSQDDPLYDNWDQDATAVQRRYHEADPTLVAREIELAGAQVADVFAVLDEAQWGRTGRRGDGASFTVDSFARYSLHDLVHHRWDVDG